MEVKEANHNHFYVDVLRLTDTFWAPVVFESPLNRLLAPRSQPPNAQTIIVKVGILYLHIKFQEDLPEIL